MYKTYIFYIDGMTCISCSNSLKRHLENKLGPKFHSLDVNITTTDPKLTIIKLNEEQKDSLKVEVELKQYIEEIGFTCRDNSNQNTYDNSSLQSGKKNLEKKNATVKILASHWFRGILGCLLGVTVLVACLATSGVPLAFMAPLALFSTLFTLALGAPSYNDAWKKLIKARTLTMDSLFALSTISILIVSIASLFVPWLPMMFEAGLLIYGFRHIGIAIEDTLKEKIGTAKFQDRTPKVVRKKIATGFEELPTDLINIDDVITVFPGEIIPLDGICEEKASIYNTILTGANLPRYFSPNEKICAGMKLAANSNPLNVRVIKTQKESYLSRMDAAIEKSILEKAPIEIKTDQLLSYFIPIVIGLSVTSGVIIGLFFSAAQAIQCAVSVLVSACPCTLGLITPMAVKTGMYKAVEHGVQFKNAAILQQSEQIDNVIFDLNGTLTTGVPQIRQFGLLEKRNLSPEDFLSICSALEKKSNHPIGKAIYSYASKGKIEKLQANQLDDSHHSGVTGEINNEFYAIGSASLMQAKGIEMPLKPPVVLAAGDQLVYIAHNNTVIGFMVMTDPLREDAISTINALKAMGKEIHLCTGADEETALRYAKTLGIQKVYANCIATSMEENNRSKTTYVYELKAKGRTVAMVGDAGNDAQAIAASDLGIAVASDGSDEITQQAAHIVIQKGTLLLISSAFAISMQTVSNIKQNLIMSLVYNIGSLLISGGLLVGLGITLNPVIGVALMFLQACIILMNVYRFKQQPVTQLPKEENLAQKEYDLTENSYARINRHAPLSKSELLSPLNNKLDKNPLFQTPCSQEFINGQNDIEQSELKMVLMTP